MKKIITGLTCTFLLAITFSRTNAQDTQEIQAFNDRSSDIVRAPINGQKSKFETSNTLNNINIKAVRNFRTSHPEISNEKWEVMTNGYKASYATEAFSKRVFYSTKGTFLHSILEYKENRLPKDVRGSVKSVYYDYAIYLVHEIHLKTPDSPPIYLLYLKFNNDFKTIRFCDGEMDVMKPKDLL